MLASLGAVPELDGLVRDVMGSALGYATTMSVFTPAVDVIAKEHELVFQCDVPGVRQDSLEIALENHVLTIKGSRKYEAGANEQQMVLGRAYGDFSLRYTLPETVEGEKLTAYLADGVLTVRVPKHPKAQPRKVHLGGGRSHTDR